MADRKLNTVKLSGGSDYAKVATRLKEFRQDFQTSKIETVSVLLDSGETETTSYIWKDKGDLLELMKQGITDKEVLHSSADANGTARKKLTAQDKDFEKLETIATGRALAMLGYLASGDIASFEEMEEFHAFKNEKKFEAIAAEVTKIESATTTDELRDLYLASELKNEPSIISAVNTRKAELVEEGKDDKQDT